MRGSEGPTSAASFHSRLPCNLNRGDIIRPSILSSTWPLGVHPTRDISAPYTAYYLDRLHLTHASRCYSKLRPLPLSLSWFLHFFLSPREERSISTIEPLSRIRKISTTWFRGPWKTCIYFYSINEWSIQNRFFPTGFPGSKIIARTSSNSILDYSSKKLLLTHGYVYLHVYIYIFSRNYPSWR